MRRREFVGLLGAAAAAPFAARAQQPDRIPRIGYLSELSPGPIDDEFRAGMRDFGWVDGKSLRIESRFADLHEGRLPALAAELVDLNVDVIVTFGTGVYAAHRATMTVPIVMAASADVVTLGFAASLSHPGGNMTGSTFFLPELMAKRLELLEQVAPSMTRAGILLLRGNPFDSYLLKTMAAATATDGVELRPIGVADASDLESELTAAAVAGIGGLVSDDLALFLANAASIAAFAEKHRLPSIGSPVLAANGGLLGYGVQFPPMFRRAAYFVDKILKGAKPGDIPIEQATHFHTTVNLKTAKAIGVEIPPLLLAGADEVIE
jgi:putative tryptophan/tyrosine transport system substrate-binding protein